MGKVKTKLTGRVLQKSDDNFDWSLYENGYCGGNSLVENKSIKVKTKGDKVFCHEAYAQDAYDMYESYAMGCYAGQESKDMTKGSLHNIIGMRPVSDHEVIVDTFGGSSAVVDLTKEKPYIKIYGYEDVKAFVYDLLYKEGFSIGLAENGIKAKVVENGRISLWDGHLSKVEQEFMDQIRYDQTKCADVKPYAYEAKVKSINGGGYLVDILGVQCFMPGSLAAAGIINDFDALVGKTIPVMIVNYVPKSGFIVSYKKYLNFILPQKIENELSVGMEVYTKVTGASKNGLFVQFKDRDGEWLFSGLIHRSTMSKDFEYRFDSREFRTGDEFKAFIHNITEVDGKPRIVIGDVAPKNVTVSESNE